MPDSLNEVHFNDLKACTPDDVVKRTNAVYDPDAGEYEINIWGSSYVVAPGRCEIFPKTSGGCAYKDFLYLFIVFFLMKAQKVEPAGTWVSEKDIKGGEGFFRGPHLIPVQLIADAVENDIQVFKQACKNLQGTPLDFADAAYRFEITPSMPVAVLFWQGDEDFPSEVKMLFDKTIEQHLALDIIFALAVEVCAALTKAAKGISA